MIVKRDPVGPGQESVWDYSRPPRVEAFTGRIRVVFNEKTIVDTARVWRVLETSHPPVYYFPLEDIDLAYLKSSAGRSFCEWKGAARYFDVEVKGRRAERAAWCYPNPTPDFRVITNHVAFFAGIMDACYVDAERVRPQRGGFYGGWVTDNISGPFKGGQVHMACDRPFECSLNEHQEGTGSPVSR
jgi:uncharacterized protein (DUF427 family)